MAESHLEFTRPSHVVGRYALYGRLAAGGMATVHLGRLLEADGTARTVAVKRLHPQFCKDPEFVAMFIDEARLAARIKHPNVVETLDILTMGQELLLVMEYIRGECFSKLLRAARRKNLEPSIGVVGRIASGLLHGLHAAHEAKDDNGELLNVVHRDISPQNVMIDVHGGVKVLDFGVAKASARIQITRDGQMKGKLSYMSPEQLQGMPVDRRADVFACGVVLWEALTRRRLFVGEDASEVLRKILRDEVPPPSQWAPGLSPEVDRVVARALCKDPQQRYQTALELALDVEGCIALASEQEVGSWLDSVAGEILGKRERLLSEIELRDPAELGLAGDALATGNGSIRDSDTFQRIQTWAEQEASRSMADERGPLSLADVEEIEAEQIQTVADALCAEGLPPGSGVEERAPGSWEQAPSVDATDEPDSAVTLADEPHFVTLPPSLPRLSPGPASNETQPAFASVATGLGPGPRPRMRRVFGVVAAAAVVMGLAAVAVIGVQTTPLVRTSGTLLPVAPEGNPGAEAAIPSEAARGEVPLDRLAMKTTELVKGNDPAIVQKSAGDEAAAAAQAQKQAAAEQEKLPAIAAASLEEVRAEAPDKEAEPPRPARAARERAAAPAPKKAARRGSARRARAAPKTVAAAAKPAPAKDDCHQPYWVDGNGIRRLKLECL